MPSSLIAVTKPTTAWSAISPRPSLWPQTARCGSAPLTASLAICCRTNLRETCIEEGFFDPSEDSYIYPDTVSVLKMPQFPAEEIARLYKTFFLYTRVSRDQFGRVKTAETDDRVLAELVGELRG